MSVENLNRRQMLLGATAAVIAPVLPSVLDNPRLLIPFRRQTDWTGCSMTSWEAKSPEEIFQDIVRALNYFEKAEIHCNITHGNLPIPTVRWELETG